MNANEVIATLAARGGHDVHPNDHVNASQSSNDTFPTAIHVAADARGRPSDLLPGARPPRRPRWRPRPTEFADAGEVRPHPPDGRDAGDARPGVRRLRRDRAATRVERLDGVLPRVGELPLGGTAVGTGINTPHGLRGSASSRVLAERTGQPFTEARNHFEAQGTRDSLVELSGVLRTIAVGLTKICNDLRWMASGPTHRAGRDPPARPPAGLEHHARQGQPGAARGDADGLRPGDRQRRRGRRGRRERATSSST